jgi:very-short-patch-repair endonuclease
LFGLLVFHLLKLIEIDGQQHLLPERVISDRAKDKLLQDKGWTVYRISWQTDNIINEVGKILASIPFD